MESSADSSSLEHPGWRQSFILTRYFAIVTGVTVTVVAKLTAVFRIPNFIERCFCLIFVQGGARGVAIF